MITKRIMALGLALSIAASAAAQKPNYQKAYEDFKRRSLKEYDDFRDKANASYEEFMRNAWKEYEAQTADPLPKRPEPPKPVVKDPDLGPSNDVVPVDQVITPPAEPVAPPQPAAPVPPVPEQTARPTFAFSYYGTPCSVSLEEKHRFTLRGVDENAVADGWAQLSSDAYLPILAECLALRKELRLCDWGYVRLLERMTSSFFGAAQKNEARLMQMYLLTQSGYKVRIARADRSLVLLLPSQEKIFAYPYLTINNSKYYITDPALQNKSYMVFDREFPKERYFSLLIAEEPRLTMQEAEPRTFTAARYPEITATVAVNRNLIDFYNEYPLNDRWNIYAKASLSSHAKEQLYPVLRGQIEGLDKLTAANRLINFVQTAFEYQIDEIQFGQERPLFADETLFYPFSDCEDRAILYSVLVRDLLGLDVVLLQYPEHLATAVYFNDDSVTGDYTTLDGKRYIVCDPTYIGASVGDAMPQFKKTAANIIKID